MRAREDLPLVAVLTDAGLSAKTLDRPALAEALTRLDGGEATVLMVSKLDRLTRSVHDATGLMLRADRAGWGLVALDVAVDTTTPLEQRSDDMTGLAPDYGEGDEGGEGVRRTPQPSDGGFPLVRS